VEVTPYREATAWSRATEQPVIEPELAPSRPYHAGSRSRC